MPWFFRKFDWRLPRRSFRPMLESLEDRMVPAVFNVGAGDVAGLIADINTANNNGQSNTINLTASTYDLTAVNNYWYGPNALPAISSTLTINGNGATIERDSGSSTLAMRLFYVSGGLAGELTLGQLTLTDVTLTNGLAQGGSGGGGGLGAGGAIFTQGGLTLDGVTLTNNKAIGGKGGGGEGGGGGVGDNGGFGGSVSNSAGQGANGNSASSNSGGAGGGGGGFITGADGNASLGGGLGGFAGVAGNDGGSGGVGSGGENDNGNGGNGGSFGAGGGSGDSGSYGAGGGGGGGGGVGGGGGAGGGDGLGLSGGNGGDGGFGGGGGNGGDCISSSGSGSGGSGGFGGGGGGNGVHRYGSGGAEGFGGGAGGGSGGFSSGGGGGGGAGMGGGIFVMGASTVLGSGAVTITNSTLTANTAQGGTVELDTTGDGGDGYGGALFNLDGSVTLNDDTLDDNTVMAGAAGGRYGKAGTADGGAVYNLAFGNIIQNGGVANASLVLNNSILANSSGGADLSGSISNGKGTNTASISGSTNLVMSQDVSGYAPASGVITVTADPKLGPLQNNGGPTFTMADAPGSAAYGTGNANLSGLPSTDQRGDPRLAAQGLDLGAYQYQAKGDFAPVISLNPTNQVVAAGQTATFTASANGNPTPTVQWQVSSDGGMTFTNISGATNTTLTLSSAQSSQNGNEYQAVFTNSAGIATTNAAVLTIDSTPAITTQPSSQTVNAGQSATFTASANGNPTPTVQWQVSSDGGMTFTNISGATNTTLTLSNVQISQNGNEYQAVFTNSAGSATGNAAVLTVDSAPVIMTQPSNQTVNAGANASFTASANGNPTPTVQWQVSSEGGKTFSNISGATSPTLTLTNVSTAMNGDEYQAVFSNSVGSATSNAAVLTVDSAPVIMTQPSNQAVNAGANASFTASANGNPTPTVQWQVSSDGGMTFSNISGATSPTLTLSNVQISQNGDEYQAVFSNGIGMPATTSAATLTVSPIPPPAPPVPPTLNVPPLLAFFDQLLGAIETVNANGTETVTTSLFGIPLLVSTFDSSGNLDSITLFGINVTILFELL